MSPSTSGLCIVKLVLGWAPPCVGPRTDVRTRISGRSDRCGASVRRRIIHLLTFGPVPIEMGSDDDLTYIHIGRPARHFDDITMNAQTID